jgi:hypothetical protein
MTDATGPTAGQKMRAEFDDALDRAGRSAGKRLVWDEHEAHALAAAATAADRRAELQQVYDNELAGESRPAILVKLSTELRPLDKAIADHIGRVRIGVGVAKSDRHQRAVNARWDRRREAQA